MSFMPETAMVLAAGLGTRMRPLTNTRPKPLIDVCGKPLIDYALDRFAQAGVKKAIVNVHYLADQIEDHLQKRVSPEVIISDERRELLETGGGLKFARACFEDAPIFCTNTDAILVDEDGSEACNALAEHWRDDKMDALLLLCPIEKASGYDGAGDFDYADDGSIKFRSCDRAAYVFTGLQIISPRLIDQGPDGAFSTKLLWDKALAADRLFGAIHRGTWLHVGDPDGLLAAQARLCGPGS